MKLQKIAAGLLSVLLLGGAPVAFAQTDEPQTLRVTYANVESTVRSANQTILANQKTLDSLESNDEAEKKQDEIAAGRKQLQDLSAQLQTTYQSVAGLPGQEAVAASLQGSIASLNAIVSILKGQEEQLEISDDTIEQTELQMDAAADEIVVAAQKLYVTYHSLDAQRKQLSGQKKLLDETLKIAQLKADLGLMTQAELLSAKQQSLTLNDSMTALLNQMQAVKNQLRVLLGYSDSYSLSISSMPEPDANFSSTISETEDRQTAQDENWTLKQKKLARDIAKDNKDSDLDSTVDDYRAASLNYTLALNTFQSSFSRVYADVAEKQGKLSSAQAAYDAKAKALENVTLQNAVGVASDIDLKSAQTELSGAQAALDQAKLALFSSQEQYRWALRGVISTSGAQS